MLETNHKRGKDHPNWTGGKYVGRYKRVVRDLNLVAPGIYPIIKDELGNPIGDISRNYTGQLHTNGKLYGVPVLYLHLYGCNMRCAWKTQEGNTQRCSTSHYDFKPEVIKINYKKVAKIIKNNLGDNIKHLYVIGGEPFLQYENLIRLFEKLKAFKFRPKIHITVETNGTHYNEEILKYIDLLSITPKLKSSSPTADTVKGTDLNYLQRVEIMHEGARFREKELRALVEYFHKHPNKDFEFKFLVSDPLDIAEIHLDYLQRLYNYIKQKDVFFLPLNGNDEIYKETSEYAKRAAIECGYRYTPNNDKVEVNLQEKLLEYKPERKESEEEIDLSNIDIQLSDEDLKDLGF